MCNQLSQKPVSTVPKSSVHKKVYLKFFQYHEPVFSCLVLLVAEPAT